jgi:hypothetical protein
MSSLWAETRPSAIAGHTRTNRITKSSMVGGEGEMDDSSLGSFITILDGFVNLKHKGTEKQNNLWLLFCKKYTVNLGYKNLRYKNIRL